MPTTDSTKLTACLTSFEKLTAQAKQPDYRHEKEVSSAAWKVQLVRLQEWTPGFRALQTSQSSPESRPGDTASERSGLDKNVIPKYLESLSSSLHDAEELSEGSSEVSPSASEDDAPSGTSPKQMAELWGLHDHYEDAVNTIDCLYQFTKIIPRPGHALHDDASKVSGEVDKK